MRRDDDDPFDDLLRNIGRLMDELMTGDFDLEALDLAGEHADRSPFNAEIHVDVREAADTIRVVADLPGVTKDDVTLWCDGRTLHVEVTSDRQEYEERIRLPDRVDSDSVTATFNNGVLIVTFEKSDSTAPIDIE